MKKLLLSLTSLLVVLSLVASAFGISVVKVSGIKIDSGITLSVGDTKTLDITFTPANTTQKMLKFSTSNKNVVSVNASGTVTAIGNGTAVITVISASNDAVKASCKVTVKAKPKVTLNVEVFDRSNAGGTPPTNNYYTNWIKANFSKKYPNITLNYVACPRSDEVNKMNIWMAANQAPDICFMYDASTLYTYYKNGGLTQLDDALNTYGQDLKQYLGEDLLKFGRYSGKQYSIVAKRALVARTATWIRKDWLDALGIAVPATTTEYYNAMKAFKEKNPGNAGKVVPMGAFRNLDVTAGLLLESFITDKSTYTRYVTGGLLKVLAPGYKEGIRFLNKMYNEGLISKEFPLDKDFSLAKADFAKGYMGSYTHNYDNPLRSGDPALYLGTLKQKLPDLNFIPIDPFKDRDGVTTKEINQPTGVYTFVPKASEKKVNEVIQYLNWMSDKDVLFYLQYGDEGVTHTIQNGLPVYKSVTGEKIMNSANNIDYTLIVNGVDSGSNEKNIQINSLAYGGYEELFIKAYKTSTINGYAQVLASVPTDAEAKYNNTVQEKEYEFWAMTITCKPSEFEDTWNKYLREYLAAGASDMLNARKAKWKETNGKIN